MTEDNNTDLQNWWHRVSMEELDTLLPKAKRYGALDLDAIGFVLCAMIGKHDATKAYRQEIACHFYLLGKVGRMASAFQAGELPSEDTLMDAAIYARMMMRIRQHGAWPA
jgi:hypothetical protein